MAYFHGMVGEVMAVLKMVKANIKHRIGAFYSVIILMAVVSLVLSYVININYNANKNVDDVIEKSKAFNGGWISTDGLKVPDDIVEVVKNHKYVKDANRIDAVQARDIRVNNKKITTNMQLTKGGFGEVYYKNDNYTDEKLKINKGEIYLTYYHKVVDGIKIGDKLNVRTYVGDCEFTVMGFQSFSFGGAVTTGIKPVCISDEDYEMLMGSIREEAQGVPNVLYSELYVEKTDDCELCDSDFVKRINKDTGLNSYMSLAYGGDSCKYISISVVSMFASIVMAFAIIVVVIVIIITANNISSTVDEHYSEYGILKANGFSKGQLRSVFVIQFALAFVIGTCIGIIVSIPIVMRTCSLIEMLIGIKVNVGMDVISVIKFMCIVAVASVVVIFLATNKVAKVSPIKAITGNDNEIYFESRLKLPISKKFLMPSLAYRNFSTNKRRYVVSTIVVSVIMFFLLSISGFSNLLESKNVMRNMGFEFADFYVGKQGGLNDEEIKRIEEIAGDYIKKDETVIYDESFVSIDNENVACMIYDDNHGLDNMVITKGRAPANDDEIVMTKKFADYMDLKIGDKVKISSFGKTGEYIICGYFPFANELGNGIAMSKSGARRMDLIDNLRYVNMCLKDCNDLDEVLGSLRKEFSDENYTVKEENVDFETYSNLINFIKMIIISVSVVLIFVIVNMICKRLFALERKDIGIYKSQGFSAHNLRMQFVVRFMISCLVGVIIGTATSFAFSEKILRLVLDGVGFGAFVMTYHFLEVTLYAVLLIALFVIASYIISRKIKKIDIRQLIVE